MLQVRISYLSHNLNVYRRVEIHIVKEKYHHQFLWDVSVHFKLSMFVSQEWLSLPPSSHPARKSYAIHEMHWLYVIRYVMENNLTVSVVDDHVVSHIRMQIHIEQRRSVIDLIKNHWEIPFLISKTFIQRKNADYTHSCNLRAHIFRHLVEISTWELLSSIRAQNFESITVLAPCQSFLTRVSCHLEKKPFTSLLIESRIPWIVTIIGFELKASSSAEVPSSTRVSLASIATYVSNDESSVLDTDHWLLKFNK